MGSPERPALPTESTVWQMADEVVENGEPLEIKLLGIQAGLLSWGSKDINFVPDRTLPVDKRRDRNEVQLWLAHELREFFGELEKSGRLCEFSVGRLDIYAHRLSRLGDGHALFENGFVHAGNQLLLNYCEEHSVPQQADYDKAPGLMSNQQIYIGDTRLEVAVSLNQAAIALANNGGMRLL